jgi:hypothetical protein
MAAEQRENELKRHLCDETELLKRAEVAESQIRLQ